MDNKTNWQEQLNAYRESDIHREDCMAAHEMFGTCCLEQPWLEQFIQQVRQDGFAEGYEAGRRAHE